MAAAEAEAAIQVVDVEKVYPDGTRALCGVSFSVQPGELFGLVGPDGAGKTTLLRILAGLLTPSAGRVVVDGIDVAREAARVKERIGYMSQRFSLSETLTVAENLQYASEIWHLSAAERRERIAQLLRFSRLEPFRDRLTRNLSGGMKQKLALSVALVHHPKILLLDEPTIGVDPISRRDFWLILYDLLRDGSTIFLSTPYMDEAERCARVAFLLGGRLIAVGSPAELRRSLPVVVLDLHCADAREARARLGRLREFAHLAPFGEHLHVTIPRQGAAPELWVEAAQKAGVAVRAWRVVEPSLEDVFLFLASAEASSPASAEATANAVLSDTHALAEETARRR